MHAFLLAIAAAASSSPAPAKPAADAGIYMFETGTSLLAKCRNKAPEYKLACTAYIVGAVDGIRKEMFLGRAQSACWPGRIAADEAQRVVLAYLDRYPDQRGAPASVLVSIALNDRFPCQK